MRELVSAVERITLQLNKRANPDLRGLPETILRAFKVQEEAGELAQAIIGTLGQNPRKGVTHTWDNVTNEAIDVALTALVFVETIRPGQLTAILADRLAYLAARAAASGAPQVGARE
jgi:NTP pyrophosphatase (non-canonical NTP hydrolase)